MYKLIAIDMDGTLLMEDKSISEETYQAIQRAKAAGVKVVLATGRPLNGIKNYLKQLKLNEKDNYALVYGGAIVQNTDNGEIIVKDLLGISDWNELYGLSLKLGVNIHALTAKGCITPKDNKHSQYEGSMNGIPVIIDDPGKMGDMAIAKIMFIDDEEILTEAANKIPKEFYEKYTIVRSSPFFLEFLHKKANKGSGIKKLAEKLHIKKEEVICIGDAGNDTHMVEYAGLGVAMGNATDELKELADFVTLSNEEHGVAHVINKFVLGK